MNAKTLVLDRNYQPLKIISWQKAITLWCQGRTEIVEFYFDKFIHSASETFKVPSVIRFLTHVFKRPRKVKFSRQNIYLRDRMECQYCGIHVSKSEFTLDHVLPKSKGGKVCFENIVTCCYSCNMKKQNRTPKEAKMVLKKEPVHPKNLMQEVIWQVNTPPDSWKDYLASAVYWNSELT